MKRIAIIPARSGSKGLKNKNIIDVCGKPLMAYTIEAACKSNLFDRIIVSTDSIEYGRLAQKYGAEVMYRGEKISNDKATTFMVIEDLLSRINCKINYFVLLQPTSPLRTEKHIQEAVDLFERQMDKYDFLVSVKEAEHGSVLVLSILIQIFQTIDVRIIKNIVQMVLFLLENQISIFRRNIFLEKRVWHIL